MIALHTRHEKLIATACQQAVAMCCICLDVESERSDSWYTCPQCKIEMHQSCIDQWFQTSVTCPNCRFGKPVVVRPGGLRMPSSRQSRPDWLDDLEDVSYPDLGWIFTISCTALLVILNFSPGGGS